MACEGQEVNSPLAPPTTPPPVASASGDADSDGRFASVEYVNLVASLATDVPAGVVTVTSTVPVPCGIVVVTS
jgi:hypothetical protein